MECGLCNDTGGVPTGEHISNIVVVKYCDCEMGQVMRDVEQESPYLLAADDVSEFWRTRPWHDRLFDRLTFLLMDMVGSVNTGGQWTTRRRTGLDELFRVSEALGLYDNT
jgi:hypothetical protein